MGRRSIVAIMRSAGPNVEGKNPEKFGENIECKEYITVAFCETSSKYNYNVIAKALLAP